MIQFLSFSLSPGRLCTIVASIVTLGTAALVALAAAAVIAATYVLSLAIGALGELAHMIAVSYNHSDPFTQLLWICVLGYVLFRLLKYTVRFSPVRITSR